MEYSSIINHQYRGSQRKDKMSMEARAAQFAPFAALTGHDAAVAETARVTSRQRTLSACELQVLSQKISYAMSLPDRPELTITFFRPDRRKDGGEYVTVTGKIKKIEEYYNLLTLTDNTSIPLDAISDISGDIFEDIDL